VFVPSTPPDFGANNAKSTPTPPAGPAPENNNPPGKIPTPSEVTVGAIIANAFGMIPKGSTQGSGKPSTPSNPDTGGGKGSQPGSNPAPAAAPVPGSIGAIINNAFGGSGAPAQSPGSKGGSGGKGGPTAPSTEVTTGVTNGVTYSVGPDTVTLNGQTFPIGKPQLVTMPNGQTVTIGPQAISIGNSVIPVPDPPTAKGGSNQPGTKGPNQPGANGGSNQPGANSGSNQENGNGGSTQSGPPTSGNVHGVTFEVNPNTVTLNGQTFSPGVPQTLTLPGGQVVAIGPDGVNIGGTFIPIPGSSNSNGGSSNSGGSGGSGSGGSGGSGGNPKDGSGPTGTSNGPPSSLKPSGVINGISYSISNSGIVIAGQTLSPAKPTTIALPGGHTAEIGPDGLSVDNVFVPIDSGNTPYSGAPSSGMISGVPYSFTPNGIIVDGQTYSVSQPTTVNLPGGGRLSIQQGGVVKINNVPVPLPGSGDAGSPPSGTTSGVGYTFQPGMIQINGQTYSLGHSMTTTLSNGQSLVITPDGGVQIGGVTIPNTNVPIGSKPRGGVINGVIYSIQPGAIVIGGTSYSLANPTTTKLPSGKTLTINPDGTVQINNTPVDSMNPNYYGNIHGVSYSLSPAGTITVNGQTISAAIPTTVTLPNGHTVQVAPDGEIAIDNIAISEPQSFVSAIAAAPTPVTAAGLTFSVGKSLVVMDGTTFTETPGATPTTIVKNGKTISIGPSGVAVDHTTVPLRGTTVAAHAKATKHSSTAKSTSIPSATVEAAASPSTSKKGAAARAVRAVGRKEKFLLGFAAGFAGLGFLLL
jgi:hypothetical protein